MTNKYFIYFLEYEGEKMSIVSKHELSKEKMTKEAERLVLKTYPLFEEKKLKYLSGSGIVKGENYDE